MKALAIALGCTLASACVGDVPDDGSVDIVDPSAFEPKTDAPGLTAGQASKVLVMLDDACSDAWCETDYQFTFKRINCNFTARTCTLTMTVALGGSTYTRACKMAALSSFPQLVHTYANGYQGLTDRLWTKVDACATKVEGTIP